MQNSDNSAFKVALMPDSTKNVECIEVTDSERLANGYTFKQVTAVLIDSYGNTIEIAPVNIRGNEIVIVKYCPHYNSKYIVTSMLDCIKRLQRMTRGQATIVSNRIEYNDSIINLSEYLKEVLY